MCQLGFATMYAEGGTDQSSSSWGRDRQTYHRSTTSLCSIAMRFCPDTTSTVSPSDPSASNTPRSRFALSARRTVAMKREGTEASGEATGVVVPGVWDSHFGMARLTIVGRAEAIWDWDWDWEESKLATTPERTAMPIVPHPVVAIRLVSCTSQVVEKMRTYDRECVAHDCGKRC